MLGMYEKRHFAEGEKVWFGRYRNLSNVLHWHFECEIIRIAAGNAQIKIGNTCFAAAQGDCFYCASEELHYIISEPDAQVDVMIFDAHFVRDITDRYTVISQKLPDSISIEEKLNTIKSELSHKKPFYREAVELCVRGLIVELLRTCQIIPQGSRERPYKDLITKISQEFSFITFEDAVRYSGYSPSHFSKMFKRLTGMTFSEYLNIIKVENAILLLHSHNRPTITFISLKCGFTSVRNFNRVFKQITGYSPHSLPQKFTMDTGLHISVTDSFNPTDKKSILI